ncbi:hypothetical protein [Kutzneria chonburiensis]|uniref:Uncharacterized protein n=1 Tax=Kutzneria chonburiensis TaxID=1483604 RepID=A0ABV6MXT5_9PSEU|nr:hypothetical protein [Kutzneria chonburiensis]
MTFTHKLLFAVAGAAAVGILVAGPASATPQPVPANTPQPIPASPALADTPQPLPALADQPVPVPALLGNPQPFPAGSLASDPPDKHVLPFEGGPPTKDLAGREGDPPGPFADEYDPNPNHGGGSFIDPGGDGAD